MGSHPFNLAIRPQLAVAALAAATWSILPVGARTPAYLYAAAVLVHYIASYDRIAWLLQQ